MTLKQGANPMTNLAAAVEDTALADFTEYFVKNYPPNCIIGKPEWHAPKIFKAAKYAIEQSSTKQGGYLIGWRSGDYLHETKERKVALNWSGNIEVLPIFSDDNITKLDHGPTT